MLTGSRLLSGIFVVWFILPSYQYAQRVDESFRESAALILAAPEFVSSGLLVLPFCLSCRALRISEL